MNHALRGGRLLAALAVTATLTAPSPVWAQESDDRAATDPTPENVAAFLDRRVPELLDEYQVPGAAVSVADSEGDLAIGGYGYADLEERVPVDAEETAFVSASVAKSLTATTALQLVDQGLLDLHTDVNEYLPDDVAVADTFPGRPVTLHDLLTHSAGFEDRFVGIISEDPRDTGTLHEYVRDNQPDRVRPPGRFATYSNYSFALTGFLVETASGRDFTEYAGEHLLDPLGMDHTAYAGPGDPQAREALNAASQYQWADGGPVPAPQRFGLNALPFGGFYTTAPDMARFMRAHLGGGTLDGSEILSRERSEAMFDRQFSARPDAFGVGYGTRESLAAGHRAVGHPGSIFGARAEYALLPEADLGIFVAANGDGDPPEGVRDLPRALIGELAAEFVPPAAPADDPVAADEDGEGGYAGTYVTTLTNDGNVEHVNSALNHVTVREEDDGSLTLSGPSAPSETWLPQGGGMFRSEDGANVLSFVVESGEAVALGFASDTTRTYARVPWYLAPATHGIVLLLGAALAAGAVLWPLSRLVPARLRRRGRAPSAPAAPRRARLLAGATAALVLGYAAGLLWWLSGVDVPYMLMLGFPAPLLLPPAIGVVATAGVLVLAAVAWARRWWSPTGRVHYTLVALGLTGFLAIAHHYNFVWNPLM
ncbi:CubicO group peptidase (beta-lactamase class C family) [Nocardiopsis sp. Huas11]|uniref:serine hydrolase domain-containing protein n=1 Tax=Nocardiopsis sp. Huas11 TaxID=2183912 RepID=UPI000EB1D38E|nr:serine hydrolase domain-containing protein [Nocardiopsis sp. Huas11]RKS08938.1 CubicO group peptidase (beta-lactamase class C family) [Nocardiopsis sp. Huas11]